MANKVLKAEILRDLQFLQSRAILTCNKIIKLGFDNTLSAEKKAEFIEAYEGMLKDDVNVVHENIMKLINKEVDQ